MTVARKLLCEKAETMNKSHLGTKPTKTLNYLPYISKRTTITDFITKKKANDESGSYFEKKKNNEKMGWFLTHKDWGSKVMGKSSNYTIKVCVNQKDL